MSVIFTDISKTDSEYIIGKNEYLQPVIVKGTHENIGKILDVEITDASYANLKGKII